jgi:hypothetical protein
MGGLVVVVEVRMMIGNDATGDSDLAQSQRSQTAIVTPE